MPAARRLSWLLLRERNQLTSEEDAVLSVIEHDEEVRVAYALSYVEMIRKQIAGDFGDWVTCAAGVELACWRALRQGCVKTTRRCGQHWRNPGVMDRQRGRSIG